MVEKVLDYIFRAIIPPCGTISVLIFLFSSNIVLHIIIAIGWILVTLSLLGVGIWMEKQKQVK